MESEGDVNVFRSSPPEEVNRLALAMETDLLRMVWLITYRQMGGNV